MTAESSASIQQRAKELVAEREKIEAELKALGSVLEGYGIGMTNSLVDLQGFPRSDIDIYAVRNARVQIIRLRADHNELTTRIEKTLHELHAAKRLEGASDEGTRDAPKPFAKINGVAPDSPAWDAGLQREDLVVRIGSINAENHKYLAAVGELVAASEGTELLVTVLREGSTKFLKLTPRKWSGRGLLGCHLVPYENN